MILVSNSNAQALAPGQALVFDNVVWKSGCAESFRNSGSSVRVGAGVYEISFHGNISGAADVPVQLSIEINGTPLPETTMIATSPVADGLENVSAETIVGNRATCCIPNPGALTISIVNTGTNGLGVYQNAILSVKRKSGS